MSACALIVDDNPHVRGILHTLVEENTPIRVCGEAADGVEAIEKAKDLRPDVVLLDISMPKMTGVEAAPVLRGVLPNAHIILVTMFADSLGGTTPSEIGADSVHCKMDGIEKLADQLKVVAAQHTDPEPERITPLCVQVAGEQDGSRLKDVIEEWDREEQPGENSGQHRNK